MFSSLRQSKRSTSPKSVETPRIVPSIRLTTATPVAPTHTPLTPGGDGVGPGRVGPKRTLVLHEAPPPLPLPPPRLVIPMCENGAPQRPPSRATSRFGSSKLRIFMDSTSSNDEMPKLVKKKKSRVALDSIKWALGDRTNGTKELQKDDRETKPRASIDSEKEREKKKWTMGLGKKDAKDKEKLGRGTTVAGTQPSSVSQGSSQPTSISSAYILSPTTPYLSPDSALSPTGTAQFLLKEPEQNRGGSLAVRAMRSVRSMARIGGWGRDSPATSAQLANKLNKGKGGVARAVGSGESWLAGAPSPQRNATISSRHSATVRANGVRQTSLDEENRPLPTIKFPSPGKEEKKMRPVSASSASSGESVLPRESASTRGPSIDSHRTSMSSRTSSGATNSQHGSVTRKTARPSRDKDTKNGERRKRGALSNIFDMTSGSSSPSTMNTKASTRKSGSTGSVESYGEPIAVDGATFELVRAVDPFSPSRGSESFLPPLAEVPQQMIKDANLYVPGHTPERRPRPRPLSDAARPRPTGIVASDILDGAGQTLPLNMLTAATEELYDLINRLDLSTTPEASPAKRWSPHSKNFTPDPMPAFALHTIERARQIRYPDVPSSVKPDRTFDVDTSFSSGKSQETPKNLFKGPFTGSLSELRGPISVGKGACESLIKQEPSITSLRPYDCVASRNEATVRGSSRIDRPRGMSTSNTSCQVSFDSPLKNVTIRRKRRLVPQQPREQSSAESLHQQLRPITRPEIRRQLGFSGTMGPTDEADDTEQTQEPFSSSEDEAPADPDSDIPDELQVILSSSCSTRSLDDTLSIPRPPESPLSDHLSLPVTTSDSDSTPGSLPGPHFSLTITAPSGISYEPTYSDEEGDHMREDDTGKKSFDFTGELNRLNQGGVRLSFVEQLEEAFKTPQVFLSDSGSASESRATSPVSLDWELPVEPKANLNRTGELNPGFQFGKPTAPLNIAVPPTKGLHSRTNTETSNLSAREIELLEDLDASMCALVTLNLSLVHPSSSQNNLTVRVPPAHSSSEVSTEIPSAGDPDSSAYRIANIDLSLIHPLGTSDRHPESPNFSSELDRQEERSIVELSSSQRERCISLESDTESKREARFSVTDCAPSHSGHSRGESVMSMSSLGSIIDSGVSDPFGYRDEIAGPPQIPLPPAPSLGHSHSDSLASIPSMSSLGRIIKPGRRNPFGYATTDNSHSRSISQATDFSLNVDDSNPRERKAKGRKSTDSEKSQFYFQSRPPPLPMPLPSTIHGHVCDDSVSNTSLGPPVSLHNASYRRHQRNRSSNDSGSSIAHAYNVLGANGGRAIWAKHQSDRSVDSFSSDLSLPRFERPGLGDKMLESAADYQGMPLTAITASPSASEAEDAPSYAQQSSFESAPDSRSDLDSLLDPSIDPSVSADYIFGDEGQQSKGNLFGSHAANRRIRPLSVFSVASATSSARDDDTMISMLGGGHVSRKLLGDSFTSSPAFKARQKRPAFRVRVDRSPSNEHLIKGKPSVASQSPLKFGSERMVKANQGLLERQSLEAGALTANAEGSEVSMDVSACNFSRPATAKLQRNIFAQSLTSNESHSRPTTIVLTTAAPDTPPTTDCSDSGSQSSIDLTRLSVALNGSRPSSMASSSSGNRIRARGQGHRRRSVSRGSRVETIMEEVPGLASPYSSGSSVSSLVSTVPSMRFEIVNAKTGEPEVDVVEWDNDDSSTEIMRRYHALRKEAFDIVQQSKHDWADTDFSRFALASFKPPQEPAALRAFYDYSVRTYTHLPSELCHRRQRRNSRPSPYGSRTPKKGFAPRLPRQHHSRTESMEQAFTCISPPALAVIPPTSPFAIDRSFSTVGLTPLHPNLPLQTIDPLETRQLTKVAETDTCKPRPRQRVASKTRRSALGWSKQRGTEPVKHVQAASPLKKSATARLKENIGDVRGEAMGLVMSPTGSLRLSRPRPKSRPQSMLSRP
ncbi:uncharacterized protein EI90DRAFT_3069364 [Cantharellus anzutake]|uniref:uncharacterized protein n=1 Tax=Cantharellus anzutake TaxID=1750568 RepID=UPI0019059D16|nr:uncharacterized protein EI90DRAFT_3069364 [Cantharellus anzutake]KAF8326870.1 hypothetical protein EI90DRAFT_3069364 [Cantharellus anzutake]